MEELKLQNCAKKVSRKTDTRDVAFRFDDCKGSELEQARRREELYSRKQIQQNREEWTFFEIFAAFNVNNSSREGYVLGKVNVF